VHAIDLNADLGEGGAQDGALIALVSSANIACGGHAGDGATMRAAIRACRAAGVTVGAHPGYEDRENFGRRALDLPPADVAAQVERQLRGFAEIATSLGAHVHHVKPHGALYNQAARDPALAAVVADATARVFPGCAFYVPPAGELAAAGRHAGLRVRPEGFVDRGYASGGGLLPRGETGALIEDPAAAVAQALEIARNRRVRSAEGNFLPLPAETLCVHGDGAAALAILRAVRDALEATGFAIRA
jgi:UPF0271 protein